MSLARTERFHSLVEIGQDDGEVLRVPARGLETKSGCTDRAYRDERELVEPYERGLLC